jgi:AraC family transcriptional regulator
VIIYEPGHYPSGVKTARRFGRLTLSETLHAAGEQLPRHAHEHASYALLLSGGFGERTNEIVHCRPGSIVYRPQGQPHDDCFFSASHCFNVEVALHDDDCKASLGASTIWQLFEEFRNGDDCAHDIIAALESELPESAPAVESGCFTLRWLQKARGIALDATTAPRTVSAIAREVGVHAGHLSRSYRARFGVSISQDLRRTRIARAKSLLAAGLPLAQVAAAAGFTDQSHMGKAFRAHAGISPRQWRNGTLLRD